MQKVDQLLTPYVAAPQRALVLKFLPLALSGLVLLIAIGVIGLMNLLLIVLLLAIALAAALLRPLSSGRQAKKNEIYANSDEFNRRRFNAQKLADSYDFIIVGAGSSGCALARNLAEEKKFTVLLMESGRDDHRHPAVRDELTGWFALLTNERFDYDLCTEVQPNMNNRTLQYGRGHVLGGSSTVNALMWVLGHRADYDDWASKHGATGWGWDSLKRHFLALERFVDAAPGSARGSNGHFFVRTVAQRSPQHAAFVQAAVAAGIPANADYNSGDNTGIGLCQQNNTPENQRVDAFTALIEPYLARSEHSNLTVVDESRVERILFDGDRAVGVVFRAASHGAGSFAVHAKREVILSAGAVHSPQLLMLSGIGPAAELKKHGIRVRVDAPGVGANVQDHVACAVNVVLNSDISSDPSVADGTGFNVTAFTTSAWAAKNEPKRGPDLQIVGIRVPAVRRHGGADDGGAQAARPRGSQHAARRRVPQPDAADQSAARQHGRAGGRGEARLQRRLRAQSSDQRRLAAPQVGVTRRPAADSPQPARHRRGSRAPRRRRLQGDRHLRASRVRQADREVRRRLGAPRLEGPRRHSRVHRAERRARLAHLRQRAHGRRRRQDVAAHARSQGQGRARSSRRRRLGDAGAAVRQHQRAVAARRRTRRRDHSRRIQVKDSTFVCGLCGFIFVLLLQSSHF